MNADNLKCHDCGDPLYKHPIESQHGPEGCQEGQLSILLHHLEAALAERDEARTMMAEALKILGIIKLEAWQWDKLHTLVNQPAPPEARHEAE